MHPYATDSTERVHVPLLLAVLSVAAAWALHFALARLHLTMPWWLDAPSVPVFYGALYRLFDRRIWWRTRRFGLVMVPQLSGAWEGYLTTSFDEHATRYPVHVSIAQDWTRISVVLETDTSRSESLVGSLLTENPDGPVLSYQYLNEPKASAQKALAMHHGTTRLRLSGDGRVLDGEYYSARGRQNVGVLHFERVTGGH